MENCGSQKSTNWRRFINRPNMNLRMLSNSKDFMFTFTEWRIVDLKSQLMDPIMYLRMLIKQRLVFFNLYEISED